MGLARADFEAILDFLAYADAIDEDDPYPEAILERLRELVPCDQAGYQAADPESRRFIDLHPRESNEDDALYWTVGPCPIMDYRIRTGDLAAVRMSDVVGRSRSHELPFYREYFLPEHIEHVLDLGLAASRDRIRSVLFMRTSCESDFSERDRSVVELLRPHLRAREARAELRAIAAGRQDGAWKRPVDAHLTAREREVLAMVADGKTNAQIAVELWITPGTVKKHLENVYVKLGVSSRAAAATRVTSSQAAVGQ